MSRQRREDRFTPATETGNRSRGIRWQRAHCMSLVVAMREFDPGLKSSRGRAMGCPETARPTGLAMSATTSLQMDHPHRKFVLIVRSEVQDTTRWTPPKESADTAVSIRRATRRTFLSLIPIPSDSALLRQTLPHDPAGHSRRAERYDGKGNLHFKHAA